MKLERIRIQKLPGIRPGFALEDLDPGINLVVGPNASGKSSLVRALRYLIAGHDRDDPPALSLEAEFEGRSASWRVIRTGSQVAWRRDGSPAEVPPLPDPRFFHCYWLVVEDLLGPGHDGDREIVDRLRRELTGGYDVDALLGRDGPFGLGPRHGGSEAKALRAAEAELRDVEETYRSLQRERDRLPALERKIGRDAGVRTRLGRVEGALELLEARRERLEAEAAVDEGFPAPPEVMERLRDDDRERIEALEDRRRELESDRDRWERKRAEAEESLERTGLSERIPEAGEVEDRRATFQGVRERLRDRRGAVRNRDRALADERAAAERLGVPGDARPALDPGAVSRAGRLAQEIEEAWARVRELEARVEGAPEAPDGADLEDHREAASALRAWLAAAGTPAAGLVPAAVAGFGGGILALGALFLGRPTIGAAVAAAAAIVAGSAAILARGRRGRERSAARERFASCDPEPPSAWSAEAVSARLEELESALAGLRERERRAQRGSADRERLTAARDDLERLEARKRDLAAELGFDPGHTAGSLHEFARLVDRVTDARAEAESERLRIERMDAEIEDRLRSVRSFLEAWAGGGVATAGGGEETAGEDEEQDAEKRRQPPASTPEPEVEAVGRALDRLAGRCDRARAARRNVEEADRNLSRIDDDLERLGGERAEIFRRAGLEPGETAELERRLDALEAFRAGDEERREARVAESRLRASLEDEEELLARVDADDEEGLRSKLAELRRRADQLEELKEERTKIQTRLEQAGAGRELESATAEADRARAALEDARDEALTAAAGRFLLENVKEEHRVEHEPEVLRDARERFRRFTHHRWELELDDEGGFVARDLRLGERRRLDQLSSGTRMQLLLAVRVAWTRTLEEDREPLPLFLDEALTTSDPARFGQVVESLASLVEEEDRQIFYLCARESDVRLWERAVGETPRVIDMAEIRFGRPSELEPDRFELPRREPVPEPDGDDPGGYAARLGVPPIDPWEHAGAIHLFHLLRDDLGRLHRLMAGWGLTARGQLEGLLKSSAAEHALPDPGARRRLEARCRVAELWLSAWREGRGRPIDRGVLEQSGAVTETFIARVADLADELGGDPVALLRELPDVPRFRSAKVAELEAWLQANDYLLPGDPLTAEKREARVLREAAGLAEPAEVREVVRWLEAGLDDGGR